MKQPTQDIFELVLARPVICEQREHALLVHLWWRAPQQGERLVQVYVDGSLTDVSTSMEQRELWLLCDRSRAHRIELLAIDAMDKDGLWTPRTAFLRNWEPMVKSEITMALVRDTHLPVDSRVRISLDESVSHESELWPDDESRIGFGAIFGLGEFGRDAITGPGLGAPGSELGLGPLGADGSAWRWQRDDFSTGDHTLGVYVTANQGHAVSENWSQNKTLDALPRSVEKFTIDPDGTLHWSL